MNITKLSSKGRVIIPKPIRAGHHWEAGQEFVVLEHGDGILLKPREPFEETCINDVASCLKFTGKAKSLDDMQRAISRGVKDKFK